MMLLGATISVLSAQRESIPNPSNSMLMYWRPVNSYTSMIIIGLTSSQDFYLKPGSDMGPQDFGNIRHVQSSQPRSDDQIYHGHHAVQLGLVHRDVGVECVLTLFLLNCLMYSSNDLTDNFVIQVPRDILEYCNSKAVDSIRYPFQTSNIRFLSSAICRGNTSSLWTISSISTPLQTFDTVQQWSLRYLNRISC